MVTPAGFEPAIFGMKTRCPGPLDEGAIIFSCLQTNLTLFIDVDKLE